MAPVSRKDDMTDASEHERRYLIIVRADHGTETARVIKFVTEKLERMSRGRSHLAFSSADGSVVGVLSQNREACSGNQGGHRWVINGKRPGFCNDIRAWRRIFGTG
jgi:hypothetical protein